jgi:flagellar hook-associated protein 3 FlgL
MRVSDFQSSTQVISNLNRLKARELVLNEQVTSGYRLNQPSDDPAGAGAVVRSNSILQGLTQDRRAATFAQGFLGAQDAVLDDATNILTRAREIATQMANGTFSDGERAAAATEVHELLAAIVATGNAELGGRRLFSAGEDVVPGGAPFVDPNDPGFDPANPYVGSPNPLEVDIGGAQRVRVTTSGDQVFGSSIAALADLEARLRAGTNPADALPALETAAGDISVERADVGTRLQRVEARTAQIGQNEVLTSEVLNTTRGADLIEIVTELAAVQGQFQVAAAAAERTLQTSLVNLLSI